MTTGVSKDYIPKHGAEISSVAIAKLPFMYDNNSLIDFADSWLGHKGDSLDLFKRVVSGSNIKTRSYAFSLDEIAQLRGQSHRAGEFARRAQEFGLQVSLDALANANLSVKEIKGVIFTSCTMPLIPAPDVALIEELGISPTVMRLPFYQHGCGGSAVGLRVAGALSAVTGPILLVSVELCSLLFHLIDVTTSSLIGSALFADGAAAVVIKPCTQEITFKQTDHKARIVGSSSYLIPKSAHLMGYNIEDNGPHLFLEKALPGVLASHAPDAIKSFLGTFGLSVTDVKHWLVHPGGKSILNLLTQALNLSHQQLYFSWEIFSRFGNMSSSTLLYVLEAFFLEQGKNSKVAEESVIESCATCSKVRSDEFIMVVGMGPGMSVELSLLRSS
jgi:alkylresorcinol/alkylpyrone synthase